MKIAIALLCAVGLHAQTLLTGAGLHVMGVKTPAGVVRLFFPDDIASGDTITATVLGPPQYLVEIGGERKPLAERTHTWRIPGPVEFLLRDEKGTVIARSALPVDPGKPPPPPASFDLPVSAQADRPATIRGPFESVPPTVRVGDVDARVLAVSPRKAVFHMPDLESVVRLVVTAGGNTRERSLRVFRVQAGDGVRVTGLSGIEQPVRLVLLVDGKMIPHTIAPRQVRPDGSVTIEQPSGRSVIATVTFAPSVQYALPRMANATLANWEAAQGIRILPEAKQLIGTAVVRTRDPLDDFLVAQQAFGGDPPAILAAMLSVHCFDLRDDIMSRGQPKAASPFVFAFAQSGGRAVIDIGPADARRRPFSQFVAELRARFSSQPIGYLHVSSAPAGASITVDQEAQLRRTNRRFITAAGEHVVAVAFESRTCENKVRVHPFRTGLVECKQ
jgi:hypothetical protein